MLLNQSGKTRVKIRVDDEKTRRIWEAAGRAERAVEQWPAWKTGDDTEAQREHDTRSIW